MPHQRPEPGNRKPSELSQLLSALSLGSYLVSPYLLCVSFSVDQHSLFSTHVAKWGCSISTEYQESLLYFLNNLVSLTVTDSLTLNIRIDLFDLGAKLTCNPIRSLKIKFHLTWSSAIT